MKTMSNHSSATPHTIKSTQTTITDALKRRAQSLINDKSVDAATRAFIRYGLEINDPWLPESTSLAKKRSKHWLRSYVGPAMNLKQSRPHYSC
jgi:hypothetical protein